MSSTPTISCSSGAATVSEITFGLAPGYAACTTTEGGTTSGYSLTGRLNSEMAPAMRMKADRTEANTGLSMKKLENFMVGPGKGMGTGTISRKRNGACPLVLGNQGVATLALLSHGDDLRCHRHAGAHLLQALDQDGVAGLEALTHHAQPIDDGTELHRRVLD